MVRLEDLRRLVENYHLTVGNKGKAKRKDQLIIDAVYGNYRRVKSEDDENVLEPPLPISREKLILDIWRELNTETKRRSFETAKCTINKNLRKMELKGLNQKSIRINTAKIKGFGETANYFIQDKEKQNSVKEKKNGGEKAKQPPNAAIISNDDPNRSGQKIKVFISYKHSDKKHNRWVRQLAIDLMEVYGIDCILDQFELNYGDSIHQHMQKIKTESTHVLFIVTPEAIECVESNTSSISFETQLWIALRAKRKLRVIPILRKGDQTVSYVEDHLYIDFRDDSKYMNRLAELVNDILGKNHRPVLNARKDEQGSLLKLEIINASLVNAAEGGDLKTFQELLNQGIDVNAKNSRGETATMWAATKGREKIVDLLLKKGADVNLQSNDGGTALIWGADYGHKGIVKKLIDAGAFIDAKSGRGTTALIVAAREGHIEIVKMLINKGAAVNAKRADGNSALKYAASKGYKKIVKILLDNGADPKDCSKKSVRKGSSRLKMQKTFELN